MAFGASRCYKCKPVKNKGKINAIRFSTLNALCKALKCQPGDLLEYCEDNV